MKKIVKNPLIILAAGVIVVAASGVGATTAASRAYSDSTQYVDFETKQLLVDILENQGTSDKADYVSVKEASLSFPGIAAEMQTNDSDANNDKPFKIGKAYPEDVIVKNTSTGNYDEYVRVMVRRSWTGADGQKDLLLDPSLIKLGVNESEWIEDKAEVTTEGQAFYLKKPLSPGETAQFLKTITIDNKVVTYVKTVDSDKEEGVVVNEYKYNNKKFFVELRVDAVQQHNATEAILGAWGVNATLDADGNITAIN